MANTIAREKLKIIATPTCVYDVVTLFGLATRNIDRDVSVAVTVFAVVDKMYNPHGRSL